jgi:hypothetical protein
VTEHLKDGRARAHVHEGGKHYIVEADENGAPGQTYREEGRKWVKEEGKAKAPAYEPVAVQAADRKPGFKIPEATAEAGKAYPEGHPGIESFLSGKTPANRATADRLLNSAVSSNGTILKVKDLVQSRVSEGATVRVHPKFGRILERPNGDFVEEARLSKTAMDYAEHLISSVRKGNAEVGGGAGANVTTDPDKPAEPAAQKRKGFGRDEKDWHKLYDRELGLGTLDSDHVATATDFRDRYIRGAAAQMREALQPHNDANQRGEISIAQLREHQKEQKRIADETVQQAHYDWARYIAQRVRKDSHLFPKKAREILNDRENKAKKDVGGPTDTQKEKIENDRRKANLKTLRDQVKAGKHETLDPGHGDQIDRVHKMVSAAQKHADSLAQFGVKDTEVHVHPDAVRLTDKDGNEYARIGHEGRGPDHEAIAPHLRETLPVGVQVHDTPAPTTARKALDEWTYRDADSLMLKSMFADSEAPAIPDGYAAVMYNPESRQWTAHRDVDADIDEE